MKRFYIFSSVALLSFLLIDAGCAPRTTSSPVKRVEATTLGDISTVSSKQAWEMEWDKTLNESKKEGKVVVYADTPAIALKKAIPIFKNIYEIDLETIAGKGPELNTKLAQERVNGLYIADVFISGIGSNYGSGGVVTRGFTDPMRSELILPEVVNPKSWYGEELPWKDAEHRGFAFFTYPTPNIAVNTELVKEGEIKSYYDLLNTKWKGKILMFDPQITGAGWSFFINMVEHKAIIRE